MEKNLYIDASHPDETRIVLKSENYIEEYEYENKNRLHLKNNIYLGKVSRIEPSLQAAFVDYGTQRHGFLAFNDIQSDYYQIPHDDKENLKRKEENLRLELKEKSKKVEETEKSSDDLPNLDSTNEKVNDYNHEKIKDESLTAEKNNQFNELKKRHGIKRYKIQEVIKPEQIILVQVLKDERGQKGAALTTFISLAGKYSVLMPNTSKGGGISRKIANTDDRKRIRNILQLLVTRNSIATWTETPLRCSCSFTKIVTQPSIKLLVRTLFGHYRNMLPAATKRNTSNFEKRHNNHFHFDLYSSIF